MKELQEAVQPILNAAVLNALGDPVKMLQAIIDQALAEKDSYHSKDTMLIKATKVAIQKAAIEVAHQWVQDKMLLIREAVLARLNAEDGKVMAAIVDGFVEKLTKAEPYLKVTL